MIHFTNVTKNHGGRVLYQNASFQIKPADRVGLVGSNGSGKTTIFRIIMGQENLDAGSITKSPQDKIAYYSQDIGEMKGRSALEEVKSIVGGVEELQAKLSTMEKQMENLDALNLNEDEMQKFLETYGDLQLELESKGIYDLDVRAKEILTGLGIGPLDYNRPVESFSGGWKMRIELAKVLTLNPDYLLMDEPTNHLDLESIIWLENWIKGFKGAVFMTSHDREFMNRIVNRIVEVAGKTITTYGGNYDYYLKERDIRRENLMASFKRQQDMLEKEKEFIAKFAARASHAAQVQSRVKKLEKIDLIEIPAEEKTIQFTFPVPPRSGNDVLQFKDLTKVYQREDKSEIKAFSNLSGLISRLNKIALVGVNGAGKSTFLKIISNQIPQTSGTYTIGASVSLGYFSQNSIDILNPNNSILEELTNRFPEYGHAYIRNLCGAFLFSGDDVDKKIKVLSGGEKSRVVLATLLASPINFLVLDEPTNHLDIVSREILLQGLQKFEGTIIIVSHDRYFLRAIANRVFEIDHGQLKTYEGNFDYYCEKKGMSLNNY